jgi:multidrug efflux system outer membrane protein
MKKIILPVLAVSLSFAACVGGGYKKPSVDLPSDPQISNPQVNKDIASFESYKWWNVFQDIVLDKMEEDSLNYNQDLKTAMARVAEAKARLTIARSNFYPSIDLKANAGDSKSIQDLKDYGFLSSRFTIGVAASYELDLWGKYIKQSESAKSDFLASQADRDAVRLTLTAEVAKTYFQLKALDSQLEIAKTTLSSREESYNVYNNRYQKGVISELDLRRVEAEMESVRAQVYTVENYVKTAETALSILIGRNPRAIIEKELERGNKIEDIIIIPEIPSAVPSDLLARRPDVKKMEWTLKSANAKIGSARAAFFPTISLTAFGGVASYELEDLFKDDKDTWSYSGDIVLPIFHVGKVVKNYQAAKAGYEQMLSSYQKTLQVAFKEILDAINTNKFAKDTLTAREKQTQALKKSYELAVKREKSGLGDLLDVLDVERMYLQSQLDLVTAQMNRLNSTVDICKALGGGWTEEKGFENK